MITMEEMIKTFAPTPEEKAQMDAEMIATMNNIYRKHMGDFPPVPHVVWEEIIAATVAISTEKIRKKLGV